MTRRTIRRYAHEIYPHPGEGEVRPLDLDVPYLYARALGLGIWGTGWFDAEPGGHMERTHMLLAARDIALTADALAQGLTGDEAWTWAQERACDETGEWIWDRAVHYGIDPHRIKPYPCGPTPDYHEHKDSTGTSMGDGIVTRIDGPEDQCEACTEEVEEG